MDHERDRQTGLLWQYSANPRGKNDRHYYVKISSSSHLKQSLNSQTVLNISFNPRSHNSHFHLTQMQETSLYDYPSYHQPGDIFKFN